nr:hypothetical protein [Tanacetum cinerariifolium]
MPSFNSIVQAFASLGHDLDDDLFKLEPDNEYDYDDPFNSKGEKIKESKLLIDELDLPRASDFLPSPEYDSFLFGNFSKVDALPSTNNEDKVFNLGILVHENLFEVINRVAPDKNVKKIAIFHASLILGDFDPLLSDHELPFHKEIPGSQTLLSFSSKNDEKVFKPRILTSKGIYSSLLLKLSHRGHKVFKLIKFLKARWRFFLALVERTSVPWMFRIFISIPCKRINSGVRNSQILNTRAHGFVLRSLDLRIFSFILGIQYPNLIDISLSLCILNKRS